MPFDRPAYGGGGMPLDSWGLPQSANARRDSEEMLARVSRSETESNESWRRIEDQLRGVARRLDSSERSQSENNRVLSKTAAEMNIAAREQSQAFDQIGQTANQSAAQAAAVAQNLDQLAHRLNQAREDSEHGDKLLGARIGETDGRIGDADLRIANTETRIANIEKTVQFATNALDHTLEKLEAQASQRANDQVEWQRRAGVTEENVVRLEEAVARLERAGSDPALERRLDGIENGLNGMVARLESYNPAAPLEDTIHALTRRLEAMERNQADLVNEMRANIVAAPQGRSAEPFAAPANAFQAPTAFEAPPFAEPPVSADPDTNPFIPAYGTETFSPDAFAAGQFSEAPAGEDPFAPLDGMVEPAAEAGEENFLAAARRSAREAAEKNESQKKTRFRWSRSVSAEGGSKRRLMVPLLVVLGVALLAIAAAVLSQRFSSNSETAPAAENGAFTEAPQAGLPENSGEAQPAEAQPQPVENAPPTPAPQAAAPAPAGPPSLERIAQMADSGNAVAQTIIGLRALGANGSGANPAEALKWLSRAAEQGHAVAQYRLGTLYERGQGVAANPATAARWYQASANQGNRLAMYNLAVAMANRSLGQPNMPEAARWFARAAGLGVGDAQFNLAVLYERGDGVPQSLTDAFKWYSIAGAAGDNGAQQRAAVLATQLSETDRTAAQRSAAAFRAQPLARAANVPPEPADLAG